MKKRTFLYTALAAVSIVMSAGLVGCGSDPKPVAVDEQVDKCAVCNMAVKNDQFAVELLQKNGKSLKFDDLGCLFQWTTQNGVDQVEAQFVRDYKTQEWVKLDEATYIFDKNIKTPMAYNVISFKNKSDAQAFLDKQGHGELLTYQELMKHVWERNKDMMKKMMDMKKGMSGGNSMNGGDMKGGTNTTSSSTKSGM